MKYDYTLKKCPFNGWKAETAITIGKTDNGNDRVLEFTTLKRHNGISTTANIFEIDQAAGTRTTLVFQDYRATVKTYDIKRATENAIRTAHLNSFDDFALHVEAATAQYTA